MEEELKESWWSRFGNLFVLPDGRRLPALLVFPTILLIVGGLSHFLYRELQIRPQIVTPVLPVAPPTSTSVLPAPMADEPGPQPVAELTPETRPIYSLRLGQGRQMDFVERSIAKLQNDQLEPYFEKVEDQYWILVGRFSDPAAAASELKAITASGKYRGEVVTLTQASGFTP